LHAAKGKEMISSPTVFIVGAGASYELKFPLGAELLNQVSDAINFRFSQYQGMYSGDPIISDCLTRSFKDSKQYFESAVRLRSVIPNFASVDEALHYLSDDRQAVSLGKLAIARLITTAERNSSVLNRIDKPSQANGTWLPEFFSLVISGHSRANIASAFEHVTIICFNYDRTLEEFLYHRLQSSALLDENEAAALVNSIRIIRPYGKLGSLPWQVELDPFAFGGDNERRDDYVGVAKNIRTFTEQDNLADIKGGISEALYDAKAIIVLGFGFHGQNMELLRVGGISGRHMTSKRVLGTVYRVFEKNIRNLEMAVENLFNSPGGNSAELLNLTAVELLQKMSPTISSLVR
jgi:hypothetical protein